MNGAMHRAALGTAVVFTLSLGAHVGCVATHGVRWAESRAPAIRVNQLGYLPHGPKWATLRLDAPQPIAVELVQQQRVLWRGLSIPRGLDEASGDRVHWIDFSDFEQSASKVELRAPGASSFPFTIGADIYDKLPVDALKYFYHNRSGVDIVEPFVPQVYSRPAGHLSDRRVACWLTEQCSYALDVSGGWYDAGDHGKYVVNGGISAWTLLSLYERLLYLSGTSAQWGDRTLNIPESGNHIPDVLDEARYEVEFLLKMQVPAGVPMEGMVHHKVHDNAWTMLAIEPPPETDERALHPPSTAATLNMAAVAAQAARLFKSLDPAFSARCLLGARSAFAAAERHPDKYAPALDKMGGGPYDDTYVLDEFFWAAAELFITTGEASYWQKLKSNPHFAEFPLTLTTPRGVDGEGVTASMSWQMTAGLGWISLSIAPSALEESERNRFRQGIIAAGDQALAAISQEGYRLPLRLGPRKKYPWGSNSFVLNNLLVLSLAHDFTHQDRYASAVIEGMGYLLGQNPLLQSYITGYGTVPLQYPHHRFWAHSLNTAFPEPPPGAVSGGPNSSLQDPQTKRSGLSRSLPPQKCFVDHIEAWSVNEVAINWNAPLAWVAIFLREYAHSGPTHTPG